MSCDLENYPDYCSDRSLLASDVFANNSVLNDQNSVHVDAVDDAILLGAYSQDEGGNYQNRQASDVGALKVNYTLDSTFDNALAEAHLLGFAWRASNPNKPLPPKP